MKTLQRVLTEIEQQHAVQFRARRERLLQDLLQAIGPKAVRADTHSLRCIGPSRPSILRVHPRPPDASDLYSLNADYGVDPNQPMDRVLVASRGGYWERQRVAKWICDALTHPISWHEAPEICADPSMVLK